MTGNDLSKLFDTQVDNTYSDNLAPEKKQRIFDKAFINVVEAKYRSLSTEKQYSELSHLIVTASEKNVSGNRIRIRPLNLNVLTFDGTTATFVFLSDHGLALGDTFTLSNATGVTGANVTYTVTVVHSDHSISAADPGIAGTYDSGSGSVTYTDMYADFLHMFSVKCRLYDPRAGQAVRSAKPDVGRIAFYRPSDVRNEDLILVENLNGVAGLPANGEVYASAEGRVAIYLYSDQYLQNLLTLTGTYTGGGTVKRIYYKNATYFAPDRDIAQLSKPSAQYPGVRTSDSFMYVLPDDLVCDKVTMDYLKVPDVVITVDDDSIELLDYYTQKMLERVVDEAVAVYYQSTRAPQQVQMTDNDIINNP